MTAPTAPEFVGGYRILKKIGEGGMGEVFLAHDERLNRRVAVKTISTRGQTKENVERFFREARIMARLRHPGIAQVHEVCRHEKFSYIVMDYIEGRPFQDVIADATIALRTKLEILAKAARAVGFAHANGILHRDIKPSNIVVGIDMQPCVLDFGLAKEIDTETKLALTGSIMGTPLYMSPEQAGGRPCDARSDVFSFGVVMFETLAGRFLSSTLK